MDDNSKYLELFFEETEENLLKLNELVLILEENPSDSSIIDEIFRSAHTLKGMAATMEFNEMAKLTHKLENVFSILKNENRKADEQVITLVFKSLDTLSELVEDIVEGRESSNDYQEVMLLCDQFVEETEDKPDEEERNTQSTVENDFNTSLKTIDDSDYVVAEAAKDDGYHAYVVAIKISEESLMINARVFLVMNKLEEAGEIMKSEPAVEILENDDFGCIFKLLYLSHLEKETISQMIKSISEVEDVLVEDLGEQVQKEIGLDEKKEENKKEEKENKQKENLEQTTKDQAIKKNPSAVHHHSSNQSIRVDIAKLDTFMSLISEMVVYRTQLENISSKLDDYVLTNTLDQFSQITTELQNLVLNIRLQPLHTVTNRFPRMMRDLGNDLGKEFDFVVEGEETELDRTIVSELSEPLIHLLRNSADHGIEMPDVRSSLGKEPRGTIKITAYQEGSRVMISISDDGKGLDAQAIQKSAERKGISTKGLSTKEIQELIFHPGFSTVEQVTNVSGRGVGMDVVKSKIRDLGGSIEIVSEVDKGSTFRLNLPLTMSIIKSLLVEIGSHTFALPLSVIQKVIRIEGKDIKKVHDGEVIMEGEKAIRVVRPDVTLNISRENQERFYLVMVMIEGEQYAIAVDHLIGQQEVVIKELGSELGKNLYYLGASIMGDGKIVLILDITAMCAERTQSVHV